MSSASARAPAEPDLVSAIAPAHSDPVMLVAVDFGTARSSYAFALTSTLRDSDKPVNHIECGVFAGAIPGQKTKTAVLLDAASLECIAFGEDAVQRYCNASAEELVGLMYFERFKMSLYEQQGVGGSRLSKATKIKSADGREVSAISVFSAALAHIRKEATSHFDGLRLNISEYDVRWVLTVPAIWSEAAKQIMLEAAHLAEMSNVVLALEPEAASVLARHEREATTQAPLPLGTVYMVLDCGGGTVDVTVHETLTVTKPGERGQAAQVKEVYKASGDAFGSTYINAAFEHVLDAIFGAEFMSSYRAQCASDWLKLLNKFEDLKLLTRAEVRRDKKRLELPKSFLRAVTDKHGDDADMDILIDKYMQAHEQQITTLFDSLGLDKEEPLDYDDHSGSLVLSQAFMHSLILPVVDKVVAHAQSVLADPKSGAVTHIFLVGGFADCPLLYQRVVASLERVGVAGQPDRVVIRPSFAGLVVMKGAVIYGLQPVITHRIMRYTYGVNFEALWTDEEFGPEHLHRQYRDEEGTLRCCGVLCQFVRAGDTVQTGIPKLHDFSPLGRDPNMQIWIVRSLYPGTRFSDDGEVCAAIPLVVPEANADNSNDRGVTVRMFFGEENIRVEVEVKATKQIKEALIDFLA